jgi:hypothetical protein
MEYGSGMEPKNLARRTVIAGAGMLAIFSGVGGAGLFGQAHADDPACVANPTDSCPDQANLVNTNPPPKRHIEVFCQPAGMAGQHCSHRWVP